MLLGDAKAAAHLERIQKHSLHSWQAKHAAAGEVVLVRTGEMVDDSGPMQVAFVRVVPQHDTRTHPRPRCSWRVHTPLGCRSPQRTPWEGSHWLPSGCLGEEITTRWATIYPVSLPGKGRRGCGAYAVHCTLYMPCERLRKGRGVRVCGVCTVHRWTGATRRHPPSMMRKLP